MGFFELVGIAIAAIVAAFFGGRAIGNSKGKSEERSAQSVKDAERIVSANRQVIEAKEKVITDTEEIRNEVSSIDANSAVDELRRNYSRD